MANRNLSDEEMAFVRRYSSLPEDNQNRLFELLNLPESDYQKIISYPRTYAFWLGVAAALTAIGGGLWAVITLAPEKATEAAKAVFGHGS